MASNEVSRRQFMGAAAAAAGVALIPEQVMALQDPVLNTIQRNGKTISNEKVPWKLRPFPMKQVRLLDGPFKQHMEANRRYLHALPTDRLAHTFRITAGLPSSAQPLGGWEKPDCELRGHFTGGHYLSGVALTYASTGDEDLKKKGDALIAELAACQKALKTGYLSAFPEELFDRLREGQKVWAPFYTLHKIMAGTLDMFVHCGNEQALDVVEKMALWVGKYTGGNSDSQTMSYAHMQRVLGNEFGGMAEVMANLYAVTGNERYMQVAKRFDHKRFFDPLAAHRDELKGLHANTQIPKVIAAARQYELTGEKRYRDISEFFWDAVVGERTYCVGGTSNEEMWNTDPGQLAKELSVNSTECCCAHNMMKLTRHLFGWSAEARLMDYYERAMFNHRLGTIPLNEDGSSIYYLPLVSGFFKPYGDQFNSFWCCTGTAVEEFGRLNDTIYFHDDDSLYVNLYAGSELEWPEKGLRVRQETSFPEQQTTTLTITARNPVQVAINLRIPYWAVGGSVKLNGAVLPAFSSPTSYLSINRVWKTGDKIELSLPMALHVEHMPDDENVQAVMYGPLVLAGTFGQVSKEEVKFDDHDVHVPTLHPVPDIVADPKSPTAWVEPDSKSPLGFKAVGQKEAFSLTPLYKVNRERYAVYWNVKTTSV
ncbi:MAG TPA: beta-L-arabinofuranosidase domain-containing protein [Terriglobales bacterium]|nr:beta-L-arabinofuranosidase domain-containing protein [Terriglobales bacterium]